MHHLVLYQRPKSLTVTFVVFLLVTGRRSLKVLGTFADLFFTTSAGFYLFCSCNVQSRQWRQYFLFQPRPFVLFTFWSAYHALCADVCSTSRAHCRAHACVLCMVFRKAHDHISMMVPAQHSYNTCMFSSCFVKLIIPSSAFYVIHVIIFNPLAICQDVEFQYERTEELTWLPEYVQVRFGITLTWK